MTTATIQKNYQHLAMRVRHIERLLEKALHDELTPARMRKLEKISHSLDRGAGTRLHSRRDFRRYLKSL